MNRARQCQLVADEHDDALTARAQARRPGVKHWWGRRWLTLEGHPDELLRTLRTESTGAAVVARNGACCYLCDALIVSWSSRGPITEAAREAIEGHRQEHIGQGLGTLDTHSGGERE